MRGCQERADRYTDSNLTEGRLLRIVQRYSLNEQVALYCVDPHKAWLVPSSELLASIPCSLLLMGCHGE